MGFGLNEPPLDNATIRNGNGSIPYLESVQQQMITWMRTTGDAPEWIGFVAYGYAAATPIYNPATENPNATDANPTAYTSVGGNVVIDFHDYMEGITGSEATNPNADARLYNGMPFPDYQGGPLVEVNSTSDPTYVSTATSRSQLAAYMAPYKTFSNEAQIPVMIGEWGWVPTSSGSTAYITDQQAIWNDAGAVIEMYWDYDVTTDTMTNPWAAAPNGVWQPWITTWMNTP
jgi:hypothetical protein